VQKVKELVIEKSKKAAIKKKMESGLVEKKMSYFSIRC
jgi:hypothetical protein